MSALPNNHRSIALESDAFPKETTSTRKPPQAGTRHGGWKFLIAVTAALLIVGLLVWQRSRAFEQLAVVTSEMAVPTVFVVRPLAGPDAIEIQLPGNVTAYTEASIYARTNGYIKGWYTDLGARLKAGQVMAEIAAPDVDADLLRATANLYQARAKLEIDQLNFNRAKSLLSTKVFSQQEFDQNRTTFDAQKAAVQAAEANLQNLSAQKEFQQITAPFDGVVTRRDTDVGALINAGSNSNSSSAQQLFHVARTDILRVFISVPEVYSSTVQLDTPAWLDMAEAPGVKFQGKVAHIAGALDASSRTLLTEVQVPNADGRLFPGAYATVHLDLKLATPPCVIPINTVLFRSQGTQVAIVDDADIVHLQAVTVGRDFGTSYEISHGVSSHDRLILNPSDSLADGEKVLVKELPPAKPAK